jgi:hypothetical protein
MTILDSYKRDPLYQTYQTITEGAFKSGKTMTPAEAKSFIEKHYPGATAKRATDEAHNYLVGGKVVATYDGIAGKLFIKVEPAQLKEEKEQWVVYEKPSGKCYASNTGPKSPKDCKIGNSATQKGAEEIAAKKSKNR